MLLSSEAAHEEDPQSFQVTTPGEIRASAVSAESPSSKDAKNDEADASGTKRAAKESATKQPPASARKSGRTNAAQAVFTQELLYKKLFYSPPLGVLHALLLSDAGVVKKALAPDFEREKKTAGRPQLTALAFRLLLSLLLS